MSLWWAKKDQLDGDQMRLIERLPMRENHLVLGPPGSGKTNVLLRRAQYVRSQGMPNVLVLSFTRALTEFVKTGCYDDQNREIFPKNLVSTIEGWTRSLYKEHGQALPDTDHMKFVERKAFVASAALELVNRNKLPRFETIFVDEAQDLLAEEVALLRAWSPTLFMVGDDRQRIYDYAAGLDAVRAQVADLNEERLTSHYRLAPELCEMADRIQTAENGQALLTNSHYTGPKPGKIEKNGPLKRSAQLSAAADRLHDQLRVYGDLIAQGDRLGVIVPRTEDRELVLRTFDTDERLAGKSQIIRARSGDEDDYDYNPAFDPERPISILTEKGSKGLEFRAAHWLFCDEDQQYRTAETYYTMVTRPKTRLDLYFASDLPMTLAKAYTPPADPEW